MAIERRNPLPVGRYWIDVIGQAQISAFDAWLAKNASAVDVVSTEHDPGEPNPLLTGRPPSNWILFRVSTPVAWEGPGLPTIAPLDVTSKADTAVRPDLPKEPLDQLGDVLTPPRGATLVLVGVGALGLLVLGAWLRGKAATGVVQAAAGGNG